MQVFSSNCAHTCGNVANSWCDLNASEESFFTRCALQVRRGLLLTSPVMCDVLAVAIGLRCQHNVLKLTVTAHIPFVFSTVVPTDLRCQSDYRLVDLSSRQVDKDK